MNTNTALPDNVAQASLAASLRLTHCALARLVLLSSISPIARSALRMPHWNLPLEVKYRFEVC
jgi:hypothetical protein